MHAHRAVAAALLLGSVPWFASPVADAASPTSARRTDVAARTAAQPHLASPDAITRWINGYRNRPMPDLLPDAVKAMSAFGVFKDTETSGLYLGFVAGVLAANPSRTDDLVARMFPLPPEDHLAVIKAVAYSGLPDWQRTLRGAAERMPARAGVIDRYLTGRLPALAALDLDQGPAPLDVMWGHWFATNGFEPILRIVAILPWSRDGNNVERLTVGSMAKWTLAQNASRDMDLLQLLKKTLPHEPKATAALLREVIEAAEIGEVGKIRKDALTAIETLKVKGSENLRNYAWWSQAGQTALALGCITASALGQVQAGIPCVIGGALSSAALKALAPKE